LDESVVLIDPALNRHFAAFLRTLWRGSSLETRIHPADEMFRYELAQPHRAPETASVFYFHTGRTIFETLERLATGRPGGLSDARILDFASGFGRSTRFLVDAIGPERVHVSEIDPDAVSFQQSVFGVRGTVSDHDPSRFEMSGSFDLVTAWSFFSHLPGRRFEPWLDCLYRLLAPGGSLILSVHGMSLLAAADQSPAGIVFRPVSETRRLASQEYGTSYVTAEFVRRAVSAAAPDATLRTFPFGLCGFQDVYVLRRPPVSPLASLRLFRCPWGVMDTSAIENGTVSVGGWASGDGDETPPHVALYFDDVLRQRSPGEGEAGAPRRWAFQFPVDGTHPDAIVRIEATSVNGMSRVFVAETLRPYLG